ncbi:transporter [Pseudocnuella soli]|uniref:transporter n=1 Tax=Pseudocnuella soli TaxID=2502779 RepID=UPI0010498A44|nr:transporter [Pseudocnuella soli]
MMKWMAAAGMLLLVQCAGAQEDKVVADRPSETQTPQLTAPKYVQLEAGIRKEASGGDYTIFHPRTAVKYGLSKKVELRVEIDADSEKAFSKNEYKYGLLPVHLGFKAALLEGNGALPQTTLMGMAGMPTWASHDNKVAHVAPQLRLLMENKWGEQWELDYNVGAEWDGDATTPQWIATIEPQLTLNNKWQLFVEAYGKWQKGHGPEHVVDAGMGYFISKNLKLDVIAGKGLSHEAPEYFISTGLAFRFKM